MENLLYLLSELEKDSSIPAIEGRLSFNIPIVEKIAAIADDVLVTKDGINNPKNLLELRKHGYVAYLKTHENGYDYGFLFTKKGFIMYN